MTSFTNTGNIFSISCSLNDNLMIDFKSLLDLGVSGKEEIHVFVLHDNICPMIVTGSATHKSNTVMLLHRIR